MASKKNFSSKRKIVKRKKTTKSVLPKILVGGAVIAGGYYLYTKILQPYLQSKNANASNIPPSTDVVISQVIDSVASTTPNVPSSTQAQSFSPIGTDINNLKLNIPITYGSKGEEIKRMQIFINGGLKNLGINKSVPIDGIFGPLTWAVHKGISFQAQPLSTWATWYNNTEAQKNVETATSPWF